MINPHCKGFLIANKNDLSNKVTDPAKINELSSKIGDFKEISTKNTPEILSTWFEEIIEKIDDPSYLSIY